ncbi:MAG: hypothetical protein AB7S36_21820, partial [Planctomycetota bacterium]
MIRIWNVTAVTTAAFALLPCFQATVFAQPATAPTESGPTVSGETGDESQTMDPLMRKLVDLLRKMDRNHDRQIDRDEWRGPSSDFARFDKNEDGVLDRDEL